MIERFRITLECSDGDALANLRRFLKTLFRAYRFRCLAVERLAPDSTKKTEVANGD